MLRLFGTCVALAPQVQEEIVNALRLGGGPGQKLIRVVTSFDRPNLHYEVFDRAGSLGAGRALADAVSRCRSAGRSRAALLDHVVLVTLLSVLITYRANGGALRFCGRCNGRSKDGL